MGRDLLETWRIILINNKQQITNNAGCKLWVVGCKLRSLGKERIYKEGIVLEALPGTLFKVKLDEGGEILAHLGGKLRLNFIRALPGDRVRVEFSPYDETKGRIVLRMK